MIKRRPKLQEEKPPYYVPSMAEISTIPPNGFLAISTFSGTGGSSLGYKMAGFQVLWANEFVEAARSCYAANFPDAILDGTDIRRLDPKAVLKALKLKARQLDLLDGSPPCASFSTAGKRSADWGKSKKYSDTEQRSDDLFFEFVRFVDVMQPKVFVAENVSGLVKGVAKGYFIEILGALKACGYRVEAKLLDAQWLGVPQQRQRIIFQGVRNDLKLAPAFPKPLPYRYSIREALPWLDSVVHDTSGDYSTGEVIDRPSPTVTVLARLEVSGVHAIDSDCHFSSPNPALPPTAMTQSPDRPAKTIGASPNTGNGRIGSGDILVKRSRLVANKTKHFGRTPSASLDEPVPTVLADHSSGPDRFHVESESDISRYAVGAEWDKLKPGEQSEKYFSLVRSHPDKPSPCVTASGGEPSIAAVTHPFERRRFSIAELRRLCGFPDDFILLGTYGQQWERLGRAVPPVMMHKLAEVIRDEVLKKL